MLNADTSKDKTASVAGDAPGSVQDGSLAPSDSSRVVDGARTHHSNEVTDCIAMPNQGNDDEEPGNRFRRWLRPGDQLVLLLVGSVVLMLMVVHWVRLSGWGVRPVEIERLPSRLLDYRVNINEATWVEWAQLEGLGPELSRRIVADRDENGPFSSVDDVRRVLGVGPKTIERLRPWLTTGHRASDPGHSTR